MIRVDGFVVRACSFAAANHPQADVAFLGTVRRLDTAEFRFNAWC